MPKIKSLTPKKLESILKRNGFVHKRTKGSHKIYLNNKTGKIVVIPFHKHDLPKGTLLEILKQAGIEKEQFEE